jgi:hypothetical protein
MRNASLSAAVAAPDIQTPHISDDNTTFLNTFASSSLGSISLDRLDDP